MTDSFPLTAAALRKHASDFRVFEQQLALELGGLSGLQINELTFARLTKPDPLRLFGLDRGGEGVLMLGTDQRDMLVPKLAETLLVQPSGGYVLDIGGGNGQTISYALEGRSEPLCLVPVDPMGDSLQGYQDLFRTGHPKISVPRVIASGIDELIEAKVWIRVLCPSPSMRSYPRTRSTFPPMLQVFYPSPWTGCVRGEVPPRVRRRTGAFHRGGEFARCLLYHQKRTLLERSGMSALRQKGT
jgi:hypothetical protein